MFYIIDILSRYLCRPNYVWLRWASPEAWRYPIYNFCYAWMFVTIFSEKMLNEYILVHFTDALSTLFKTFAFNLFQISLMFKRSWPTSISAQSASFNTLPDDDPAHPGAGPSAAGYWLVNYSRPSNFKPSPPSAAYMCQWICSALVQIMACRLSGANLLSET